LKTCENPNRSAHKVYVPGAFVTGPLVGWLGCRYTFILATALIAAGGWETFWERDQKQGLSNKKGHFELFLSRRD